MFFDHCALREEYLTLQANNSVEFVHSLPGPSSISSVNELSAASASQPLTVTTVTEVSAVILSRGRAGQTGVARLVKALGDITRLLNSHHSLGLNAGVISNATGSSTDLRRALACCFPMERH